MTDEEIAEIAHEMNRRWCQLTGDASQPPWSAAPAWQKQSAIHGVQHFRANPDITLRDSHANWYNEKLAEGWKYGPVKDPDKKEHPCMVDYDDLPPIQRAKDTFFITVVRALVEMEKEKEQES